MRPLAFMRTGTVAYLTDANSYLGAGVGNRLGIGAVDPVGSEPERRESAVHVRGSMVCLQSPGETVWVAQGHCQGDVWELNVKSGAEVPGLRPLASVSCQCRVGPQVCGAAAAARNRA